MSSVPLADIEAAKNALKREGSKTLRSAGGKPTVTEEGDNVKIEVTGIDANIHLGILALMEDKYIPVESSDYNPMGDKKSTVVIAKDDFNMHIAPMMGLNKAA